MLKFLRLYINNVLYQQSRYLPLELPLTKEINTNETTNNEFTKEEVLTPALPVEELYEPDFDNAVRDGNDLILYNGNKQVAHFGCISDWSFFKLVYRNNDSPANYSISSELTENQILGQMITDLELQILLMKAE